MRDHDAHSPPPPSITRGGRLHGAAGALVLAIPAVAACSCNIVHMCRVIMRCCLVWDVCLSGAAAEVATAETDEIKFIKSKVRVALSQAERERQIALKARIKAEEEAEEARIAAQMEADRQAAIAVCGVCVFA